MRAVIIALCLLASVSACNTVKGMGQDIEKGGEKIQQGAKKVQKSM